MFYYYWFVVTIGGLLRMLRIILTTLCTPHPLLTRYSKTFLSVEYELIQYLCVFDVANKSFKFCIKWKWPVYTGLLQFIRSLDCLKSWVWFSLTEKVSRFYNFLNIFHQTFFGEAWSLLEVLDDAIFINVH